MENSEAVLTAALCSSTGEKSESEYFVQPFRERGVEPGCKDNKINSDLQFRQC